mmetsp:Transcript_29628/g.96825  ORF Transcript_29628/g.96825 Transcript_29628/m.96825 type:complete len:448 (-) Transcript_29628:237-1580(-)
MRHNGVSHRPLDMVAARLAASRTVWLNVSTAMYSGTSASIPWSRPVLCESNVVASPRTASHSRCACSTRASSSRRRLALPHTLCLVFSHLALHSACHASTPPRANSTANSLRGAVHRPSSAASRSAAASAAGTSGTASLSPATHGPARAASGRSRSHNHPRARWRSTAASCSARSTAADVAPAPPPLLMLPLAARATRLSARATCARNSLDASSSSSCSSFTAEACCFASARGSACSSQAAASSCGSARTAARWKARCTLGSASSAAFADPRLSPCVRAYQYSVPHTARPASESESVAASIGTKRSSSTRHEPATPCVALPAAAAPSTDAGSDAVARTASAILDGATALSGGKRTRACSASAAAPWPSPTSASAPPAPDPAPPARVLPAWSSSSSPSPDSEALPLPTTSRAHGARSVPTSVARKPCRSPPSSASTAASVGTDCPLVL